MSSLGDDSSVQAGRMLGKLAVQNKLISNKDLRHVVGMQLRLKEQGINRSIGELLVREGLLTQEELDELLRKQEDLLFGRIAIANGLVAATDVKSALERQKLELQGHTRIGEILVSWNKLSKIDCERILQAQDRLLWRTFYAKCSCGQRTEVASTDLGNNVKCKKCGTEIKGPTEFLHFDKASKMAPRKQRLTEARVKKRRISVTMAIVLVVLGGTSLRAIVMGRLDEAVGALVLGVVVITCIAVGRMMMSATRSQSRQEGPEK